MFENFSLWPESASSLSGSTDLLYGFLIGVSAFFSLLIVAALLLFSIRYRRRPGHRATPIEGSLPLELLWTLVPLAIVLGFFVWGTRLFVHAQTAPEEAMRFTVTGKQWMWKIQHPGGQSEINTLHVPTGRKVVLTMISEDVIHSFYVPAFRVKQDVLPAKYTQLWFEPTKAGTYHLFCAEYCGTKHSEMKGSVVVLDPAEYQAWLDGRPAEQDPLVAGTLLWQNLRCDTCHERGVAAAAGGQPPLPARGPDLAGRFGSDVTLADGQTVRFDERYVRESVLEPAKRLSSGYPALMPSYQGQVSESDLLALAAYLKSLKSPRSRP